MGWQLEPLARLAVQSPTPPFAGGVEASQDAFPVGSHVAGLRIPFWHVVSPLTAKPGSHVYWQLAPLSRGPVQVAALPFCGGSGVPQESSGPESPLEQPIPLAMNAHVRTRTTLNIIRIKFPFSVGVLSGVLRQCRKPIRVAPA